MKDHKRSKAHQATITRSEPLPLDIRSIDSKARTAEFVASTEVGVRGYFGSEYLRAAGCDLTRFAKNPVFLDTHSRDSVGCVIGRAQVTVDPLARQVLAKVEYANTQRAQDAWALVEGGFVRAVSVGFMPTEWRELEDGEVDGEGDAAVTGPGIVITKWELYELSQCPVPADENALIRKRFFGAESAPPPAPETPKGEPAPAAPAPAPASPAAPTPAPGDEKTKTQAPATTAAPSSNGGAPTSSTPPSPGAPPTPRTAEELEAERSARIVQARKREILEFAPASLREFAEGLVLEGLDVAQARKRLLEEWATRSKPVGTPEPPRAGGEAAKPSKPSAKDIPDDTFARAFNART